MGSPPSGDNSNPSQPMPFGGQLGQLQHDSRQGYGQGNLRSHESLSALSDKLPWRLHPPENTSGLLAAFESQRPDDPDEMSDVDEVGDPDRSARALVYREKLLVALSSYDRPSPIVPSEKFPKLLHALYDNSCRPDSLPHSWRIRRWIYHRELARFLGLMDAFYALPLPVISPLAWRDRPPYDPPYDPKPDWRCPAALKLLWTKAKGTDATYESATNTNVVAWLEWVRQPENAVYFEPMPETNEVYQAMVKALKALGKPGKADPAAVREASGDYHDLVLWEMGVSSRMAVFSSEGDPRIEDDDPVPSAKVLADAAALLARMETGTPPDPEPVMDVPEHPLKAYFPDGGMPNWKAAVADSKVAKSRIWDYLRNEKDEPDEGRVAEFTAIIAMFKHIEVGMGTRGKLGIVTRGDGTYKYTKSKDKKRTGNFKQFLEAFPNGVAEVYAGAAGVVIAQFFSPPDPPGPPPTDPMMGDGPGDKLEQAGAGMAIIGGLMSLGLACHRWWKGGLTAGDAVDGLSAVCSVAFQGANLGCALTHTAEHASNLSILPGVGGGLDILGAAVQIVRSSKTIDDLRNVKSTYQQRWTVLFGIDQPPDLVFTVNDPKLKIESAGMDPTLMIWRVNFRILASIGHLIAIEVAQIAKAIVSIGGGVVAIVFAILAASNPVGWIFTAATGLIALVIASYKVLSRYRKSSLLIDYRRKGYRDLFGRKIPRWCVTTGDWYRYQLSVLVYATAVQKLYGFSLYKEEAGGKDAIPVSRFGLLWAQVLFPEAGAAEPVPSDAAAYGQVLRTDVTSLMTVLKSGGIQ